MYAQSLHLDAVFRVWDCFLWESFKNRGPGAAGVASAGAGNAAAAAASAAVSLGAGNAIASKGATAAAGGSPASPASSPSAASASSSPTASAAAAAAAASLPVSGVSASSALHVHSGHGFPFLFRVALGILSMFSDALCSVGFEEALHFLHHLPGKAGGGGGVDDLLDIDLLFQHVRTIKMETSIWAAGTPSK